MRIFITGATGLVGRRLVADRLARGDEILALSRDAGRAMRALGAGDDDRLRVVEGDPVRPGDWQATIDGCDAVVHLAGAGIVDHRWTASYKDEIASSRIDGTRCVVEAIGRADRRPAVLVNASAIGWYGETGDRPVDERAPSSDDFLGRVCVDWEHEAQRAETFGVRVVRMRIGVVLAAEGGALAKMVPQFRRFVGGPLGIRRAWVSWIHRDDLVGLLDLALRDVRATGPINAVAPNPTTNWDLARAIGRALGRPWFLPAPILAVRVVEGEAAWFIARSQRVEPAKALTLGHRFAHPHVGEAVAELLRTGADGGPPPSRVAVAAGGSAPAPGAAAAPPPADDRSEAAAGPTIRLVAVDVDGTLLGPGQTLAPAVVRAWRAARATGCRMVLATARGPGGVIGLLETLGSPGPAICLHGAYVWGGPDRPPLLHVRLDPALAHEVIEVIHHASLRVLVGMETGERWFAERLDRRLALDRAGFRPPAGIGPLDRYVGDGVTRISALGDPAILDDVVDGLSQVLWPTGRICVFRPNPRLVQVTSTGVDKGIALERLAGALGIEPASVMAIGNGRNDLGMIGWAGTGVAVAGAPETVRRRATCVVEGADGLGVARALERFVLGSPAAGRVVSAEPVPSGNSYTAPHEQGLA